MEPKPGSKQLTAIMSESIRATGESIGISEMTEEAAEFLAEEITFRLQKVIQESAKMRIHARRSHLVSSDIDATLSVLGEKPTYGFRGQDDVPFRYASGGGRELFFTEEKELDLSEIMNTALPKIPHQPTVRAHWLAVEGVQPAVPENPPPVTREAQRQETLSKAARQAQSRDLKKAKSKHSKDGVLVKQAGVHELSMEQQLYYKEVTEACVGSDETKRQAALHSLATDPGLHHMLPRFSCFISEGVRVNIALKNMALLIYLMRMVLSLLENSSLYLERYLHELHPAILSCVVSRQLCLRPEFDNHWALRDFAAKHVSLICSRFNNSINSLQPRTTKLLCGILHDQEKTLATHYGCVFALCEMGSQCIQLFVLDQLKVMGDRMQAVLEGGAVNKADEVAADHLRSLILKQVPPVLKTTRQPPDQESDYITDYGLLLGRPLYQQVHKLRTQSLPQAVHTKPVITLGSGRPTVVISGSTPRLLSASGSRTPSTPVTPLSAGGKKQVIFLQQPSRGQVLVMKGADRSDSQDN